MHRQNEKREIYNALETWTVYTRTHARYTHAQTDKHAENHYCTMRSVKHYILLKRRKLKIILQTCVLREIVF